jgi:hypothetical protein
LDRGEVAGDAPERDAGTPGGREPADASADPIEVWVRRIGRGLSVVGVVVLTWWLFS